MAVREGLLALLREGPRHGYQLKTAFEAATGGVWPLNVGQVYTTLDRLERDGMVQTQPVGPAGAADSGDGGQAAQRTYSLTPAGEAELRAWWDAVAAEGPPPRDELMLKVLMAVDAGHDEALWVVTHQRTVLLTHLQRVRRERTAADGRSDLAARLVTEALIARAEADLRWLDTCETHLLADRKARR
jgi:DNA-binding PadR family transcriptional regulator